MAKEIFLFAANGQGGLDPVIIRIDEKIPEFSDLNEARILYSMEAKKLASALWDILPGGTISALFAEMCERHINLLRVPNPREGR